METFISGIRGELELRAVVLHHRSPFRVDCREVDDDWDGAAPAGGDSPAGEDTPAGPGETVLATLKRQRLQINDNHTLGEKLRKLNTFYNDAHVILAPRETQIDERVLVPILQKLNDHIAIVRAGSAVLLRPDAHVDLKVDEQCYIVVPPNLVERYAGTSPEPLHLVVYVLAVIFTVLVILVVFFRTRRRQDDGAKITFLTF